MCLKFLRSVFFLLTLIGCNCHLATKRLYEDLLNDYNRLIRPVVNNNDTIYVNLSLKLTQLLDINMKQQVMSTNVWVEQNWFDFQLQWNPKDYDGVDMIYIPAEEIWQPDIVLFNNWDGIFEVASMTKALVYHTGEVYWKPPALFKSTCEIDVQYFPFDIQTCSMKFASWTYDGLEVDLRSVDKSFSVKPNTTLEPELARLVHEPMKKQDSNLNDTTSIDLIVYGQKQKIQPEYFHKKQSSALETVEIGIDMSEFYSSVEWDVLSVPAHYKQEFFSGYGNPYPEIVFKIKLRRKTLFYTVNLIIPIVGNAFMTLLVFFLPSDSGEKVALSISLLVSLTVFFLLLAEIIPPTSLAVPLLGKYLLFTMILITLSICCTVGTLNIHYRSLSTHIMQPWIKRFFIEILPKYLLMHRPTIKDLQKELRALSKPKKFHFKSCNDLDNSSESALKLSPSAPAACSYYGYHEIQSNNASFEEEELNKSAFVYNFNSNQDQPQLPYDTDLGMPSLIFPQIQPRNFSSGHSDKTHLPISIDSSPSASSSEHKFDEETKRYGKDVEDAIHSIITIAEHLKREDEEKNAIEDWKYISMTLDRLFLILFTFIFVVGSIILLQAPSLYDISPAIESPNLKSLVTSTGI